jgi:hypothetical protein
MKDNGNKACLMVEEKLYFNQECIIKVLSKKDMLKVKMV